MLFMLHELRMAPSTVGLLLGLGAVGGVTGGLLVGRAMKRFGPAATLATGTFISLLSMA